MAKSLKAQYRLDVASDIVKNPILITHTKIGHEVEYGSRLVGCLPHTVNDYHLLMTSPRVNVTSFQCSLIARYARCIAEAVGRYNRK